MTHPVAITLPQSSRKQLLRVGFLSGYWCSDDNWLTTLSHMKRALMRRGLQVVDIGKLQQPAWQQKLLTYKQKVWTAFGSSSSDPTVAHQRFMTQVHQRLNQIACDVIFAPVATAEIARLQTTVPIVYLSDSTTTLRQQHRQPLPEPLGVTRINYYETLAITKANQIIYPSEYAAHSAIEDYGASYKKVSVIPFGANIATPPSLPSLLAAKQWSTSLGNDFQPNAFQPCRLLWMGSSWNQQEEITAFQTLLYLLNQGIDAELTVVGGSILSQLDHERLTILPSLNSSSLQQRQQRHYLFKQAHFFLLPARTHCYGTLLSEANAFGIPILATQVGDTSATIQQGRNGYIFPASATAEDYASLIVQLHSDPAKYHHLVSTTREEYDQRLNWDQWAEGCHRIFNHIHRSVQAEMDFIQK